MNSMPNFVMMIGLPGSGKTYRAHRLGEQFGCNFVVCSSDEYRQRLFGSERDQEHNDVVFRRLHNDIKEYLSSGKNVIFDATNVSAKKRYAFLDSISSIPCKKIAYVMPVGVQKSKERDVLRERSVGFHVINKFASAFQFPQKYEGWDLICIDGYDTLSSPSFIGNKRLKDLAWARMCGFDQQNPHHRYDLSEHCERVAQAFPKDSIEYQAGALHDIAKTFPWVRTFSEDQTAHYYGHDCQGTLWLLENLEILKSKGLQRHMPNIKKCLETKGLKDFLRLTARMALRLVFRSRNIKEFQREKLYEQQTVDLERGFCKSH